MCDALTFYKSLAEETRLKSLLLLMSKGELCVCDLMSSLDLSQPKVSRHLAELRKNGLVSDQRRGKWVYYRLNDELPVWMQEVLNHTLKNNQALITAELHSLSANLCDF
ncbi:metalloregulator ArsR/SmtB family transcription factor [Photobacterium sp. WH77]|uniref:Metalloregulator ArsR/SmtB family transcription factor n=1 Tax=Photobacterium arenosum TaxID=2774143 RepID=A0ABR9BHW9_9GAMM|nr:MULTISPECIES: metalloregulator ArsR/SmtB family transcription factor [Photobacterium]MBD8511961.1 metalloregulator ArsR/SmtB family transcription factor [Photobacterium arenosum]MBV7261332.1 metalloregulator ArsR/SmtB family transcription factor [Photobacterium sp. WH24]MCG2836232.1 metalloregulator ArsR/SmtB family transcription factor [Photobacterium sp. WH77]MCG2843631.1 metalloregulator ArsR/SmtB family transcription factor [Photobacterium sp. WH80]MDO6581058.1 metalloregulator ArsR/Smt